VERRIYPGARHEIFNEINRAEVLADTTRFIDAVVAQARGR
jgi:alpha-beta hydrolase superfamily lysophospholipase